MTRKNESRPGEKTFPPTSMDDAMGYTGGAAAVGAALGLLLGMTIDESAWGVIVGVALGFVVGTIIDRKQGPGR